LPRSVSHISEGDLVGIESRVEEVMKLLDIGEGGVRFIGIHGMCGVGKSTLARVIYDRVSRQFEVRCFLACKEENSSGTYSRINRPLNALRNQLISKILKGKEINILDDRES
jgi:predicted ATP-dependent serine protease